MITKLRFLKQLYNRTIAPAAGNQIGSIIYVSKLAINNLYKKYVVDIDNSSVSKYLIDSDDEVVETVFEKTAPINDKKLYVGENKYEFPVIVAENKTYNITSGATLTVKLQDLIKDYNKINVSQLNTIENITFNKGTITVSNTLAVGTYKLNYDLFVINEPNIKSGITITIIVNPK